MQLAPTAVVTGAFSYTGSAVAGSLIKRGFSTRTLTRRRSPINDPGGQIKVHPLQFDNRRALVEAMRGARLFVNTYWVRYPYVGVSFDRGREHSDPSTRRYRRRSGAAGARESE